MHPTTYICVHTAQRTQASPTGRSEGASPTGCLPTKQTKSQSKAIHIHSKPFTARPKPDLSPSAEGQPRVSRGSEPLERARSRRSEAAAERGPPLTHGACGCYPPPPPTGNGGGGSPPPQPTKRAGAPGHHLTEGGGGPRPQAQTRTHGATGEPLRKGRVRKYPAAPLRAAPPRRPWRAWKETALPDRRSATYPKGAKRLEGATRRYRRPTRHRGCAGKRQGQAQG